MSRALKGSLRYLDEGIIYQNVDRSDEQKDGNMKIHVTFKCKTWINIDLVQDSKCGDVLLAFVNGPLYECKHKMDDLSHDDTRLMPPHSIQSAFEISGCPGVLTPDKSWRTTSCQTCGCPWTSMYLCFSSSPQLADT